MITKEEQMLEQINNKLMPVCALVELAEQIAPEYLKEKNIDAKVLNAAISGTKNSLKFYEELVV